MHCKLKLKKQQQRHCGHTTDTVNRQRVVMLECDCIGERARGTVPVAVTGSDRPSRLKTTCEPDSVSDEDGNAVELRESP